MQTEDWLARWQENRIGFHSNEVNPHLKAHIARFKLKAGDCVFLPLCGKSKDIVWLAEQGFEVLGVELSGIAIEAFFSEAGLSFQRFESDNLVMYKSSNITLFEGDFFDLQPEHLRGCKLVFDRAALIAIDAEHRPHYSLHMRAITPNNCNMLLITLEYEQSKMSGPPFSVSRIEIELHYQGTYQIDVLKQIDVIDEQPRWRQQGLQYLSETVVQLSRNQAL